MGTALSPVRRLRAAAAALLLVPLLAGCGGDEPQPRVDEPRPSPPASASVAPSPSATPEPWEVRSKAGAVAFVEHWVDLLTTALQTGDPAPMLTFSVADCESCASIAGGIRGIYAEGNRIETEGWVVRNAESFSGQVRPPFDFAVQVKRAPERVISTGGAVEQFEGSTETYSVQVDWVRGAWRVLRFDLVQP